MPSDPKKGEAMNSKQLIWFSVAAGLFVGVVSVEAKGGKGSVSPTSFSSKTLVLSAGEKIILRGTIKKEVGNIRLDNALVQAYTPPSDYRTVFGPKVSHWLNDNKDVNLVTVEDAIGKSADYIGKTIFVSGFIDSCKNDGMGSATFLVVLEGGLACRITKTSLERGKYFLKFESKMGGLTDVYIQNK
jgi:hypothetical protein